MFVALALVCMQALAEEFQAVSSVDPGWRPREAHLTLGVALQLAEAEALKRGLSTANYQPPRFRYDYEVYYPDNGWGDYVWAFVYDGKVPAAANHFVVIINDRTRYAEFIPGR